MADGTMHSETELEVYIRRARENGDSNPCDGSNEAEIANYSKTGKSNPDHNGLYLSRNMSKGVYRQTIKEFYNIKDTVVEEYYKGSIEKSIEKYDKTYEYNAKRMGVIKDFLSSVDCWISSGIKFINDHTVPCSECNESINRKDILKTVNNYWSKMTTWSNANVDQYFQNVIIVWFRISY